MVNTLFSEVSLKRRRHAVHAHPIYNFLHKYYQYSSEELLLYSPGMGVTLKDVQEKHLNHFQGKKGKGKQHRSD